MEEELHMDGEERASVHERSTTLPERFVLGWGGSTTIAIYLYHAYLSFTYVHACYQPTIPFT